MFLLIVLKMRTRVRAPDTRFLASLAWPDHLFFDMGAEKIRVWRTTVACFVHRIARFWQWLIDHKKKEKEKEKK